jgi:hypothetical protein
MFLPATLRAPAVDIRSLTLSSQFFFFFFFFRLNQKDKEKKGAKYV